jgi:hypothetical protein
MPADMVSQDIRFVHQPSQIRWAALRLAGYRLRKPRIVLVLVALLLLLIVGVLTSNPWLVGLPIGVFVSMPLVLIFYIVTSPRHFRGVEVQISVREDGVAFAGANRSSVVSWAGFKDVYCLKTMWAVMLTSSESVTFLPVDQLNSETLAYMLAKLRENGVKIYGDVS